MAKPVATASITAENTFTDWVAVQKFGHVSVSGISDSTVTVQRSFDEGSTIKDVESFTADFEKIIQGSQSTVWYRVGVKTGNYGTDTIACRVSQ